MKHRDYYHFDRCSIETEGQMRALLQAVSNMDAGALIEGATTMLHENPAALTQWTGAYFDAEPCLWSVNVLEAAQSAVRHPEFIFKNILKNRSEADQAGLVEGMKGAVKRLEEIMQQAEKIQKSPAFQAPIKIRELANKVFRVFSPPIDGPLSTDYWGYIIARERFKERGAIELPPKPFSRDWKNRLREWKKLN